MYLWNPDSVKTSSATIAADIEKLASSIVGGQPAPEPPAAEHIHIGERATELLQERRIGEVNFAVLIEASDSWSEDYAIFRVTELLNRPAEYQWISGAGLGYWSENEFWYDLQERVHEAFEKDPTIEVVYRDSLHEFEIVRKGNSGVTAE